MNKGERRTRRRKRIGQERGEELNEEEQVVSGKEKVNNDEDIVRGEG